MIGQPEPPFPQEDIDWCRQMFDSLNDGGQWGIPRSGLIFTREGEQLVLTDRMPWLPWMPLTEQELIDYQDGEYAATRARFRAAGIEVEVAGRFGAGEVPS